MKYQVVFAPGARLQLTDIALWWSEHRSTEQAIQWLTGFEAKIRLLTHNPERWPLVPERELSDRGFRQLTYGLGKNKTHRAVFRIDQQTVTIHVIRHLAQDALRLEDIRERPE